MDSQHIFDRLEPLLKQTAGDPRPVVLATCGMAGAGKSTLSKTVLGRLPHFTRLSVDETVFQHHGVYGIDYPADMALYDRYLDEASEQLMTTFKELLTKRQDVILDRSFYSKKERDEFLRVIDQLGGRRVLVFLKADKDLLWERITSRSKAAKTANNALDISRELFESYWAGFENPSGEGEIVVEVK
jgi:predicted kinase